MSTLRRAALYARTGAPDPAGIERQLTMIRHYAGEHGLTITGTYADDGCSGLTLARPGLERLRADWHRRLFTRVLVLRLEDLADNLLELDALARELHVVTVHRGEKYLP